MAKSLIILGPPGAGKGTQAVRIAERVGVQHISTGDLLRDSVSKGTELGKKAEGFMNQGLLVPDDIILGMISNKLNETFAPGWILDGFPRTVVQAEALSGLLKEKEIELDHVILIDVDSEILVKRLTGRRVCADCGAIYNIEVMEKDTQKCVKCGGQLITRDDDREETVRRRLEVYNELTAPVLDYYSKTDELLMSIDGARAIDEITLEIMKGLS
ncbi:adenylate kinase [bacterium]|nr:adenylate kinase [bacterium]